MRRSYGPRLAATWGRAGSSLGRGGDRLPVELWVLVLWCATLLLLPSQLVVSQIGSPGRPAGLIGIALLLWWVLGLVSARSPVRGPTVARATTLLLAAVVVAAYVNGNTQGWYAPLSVRQETDEFYTLLAPDLREVTATMISAGDRGMLALLGWLGVVLVTAEAVRGWRDLERVLTWLVGLATVVASIAVVEFTTGVALAARIVVPGLSANSELEGVISRSVVNRVSATAVHPIELGVVLACVFPFALHRLLYRRRAADVLATGLIGLAALMTVSRSAIVCLLAAGLVVWVGWPRRWKLRSLLLVPFAAFAVRGAVPGLLGTIRSLFSSASEDPSVTGRTADYAVVLDLYGLHPWIGRGLYTFVPRNYRILDNQMLMVLVELGAVGAFVVATLLVAAFLSARSGVRGAPDAERADLARSVSAAIAAWTLGMTTFDTWTFPMAAGVGFLLIGLAFGVRRAVGLDPGGGGGASATARTAREEPARAGS